MFARLSCTLLIGVMAAILATPPALGAITADEPAGYYEEALSYFNKGDYRSAIIELKNLLQAHPDDLAARLLIGRAYIGVGNGVAAEKQIRRARSGGTDETLVLVPLARAYLLQRKYDELLAEIRPKGLDPELDSAILVARGRALLARRNLELAEKTFKRAAFLQPDSATPLLGLAQVELGRGHFADAGELVDRAIAIAPDDAEVRYIEGDVKRLSGDPKAAIESYDRAIEIVPGYIGARMARAALLIDLDRHERALADIEFVRSVTPTDPQAAYYYAMILARLGKMTEARDALREAGVILKNLDFETVRNHPPTLLLAGVVNYVQKKYDAAFTYLDRYVALAPVHAGARKLLGTLLLMRGDVARAVDVLHPLLDLAPDDPQTYTLLGDAFARARRNSEAMAMFEKAVALLPDEASLRTKLALVRFASGQSAEAAKDLESALAVDPDAFQAGVLLGLVHLRANRFDEALGTIDELMKRRPENPIPLNMAGAAQLGLHDDSAARDSFERAIALDAGYLPAQYNLARLDRREGNIAAARERFRTILEKNPLETSAMIELAGIAEGEGALDDAIKWREKVRSHLPDAIEPQIALIRDYSRAGKPEAALTVARELETRAPASLAVLEALGQAQIAAGQTVEAERTFRHFVEIAKDSPQALYHGARLQLGVGDEEGAHASLERAVKLDPASLPAQAALIELDARAGKFDAALARATALRRAHPDTAAPDMLTGDLLMHARRFAKAAKAYAAGWKKGKSSALVIRLYRARRAAGEGEAALPLLETWVAAHADDIPARRLLAAAYSDVGRIDTAIEEHERLREILPDDAAVLNNLAGLYQLRDDPRAVGLAEKAVELAPDEAATLDTLGWILVQRGDPARGLKYLRAAFSRASRDARVRYHLGAALSALDRNDEARRELEHALRIDGAFEGAAEARALLDRLSGS